MAGHFDFVESIIRRKKCSACFLIFCPSRKLTCVKKNCGEHTVEHKGAEASTEFKSTNEDLFCCVYSLYTNKDSMLKDNAEEILKLTQEGGFSDMYEDGYNARTPDVTAASTMGRVACMLGLYIYPSTPLGFVTFCNKKESYWVQTFISGLPSDGTSGTGKKSRQAQDVRCDER